jgi:signal transduction histidine kinase
LREIRGAAGGLRDVRHPVSTPIESPMAARLSLGGIVLCTGLIQVVTSQVNFHRPWRLLLLVPLLCAAAAVILWMQRSRRQIALLAMIVVPSAIPAGYFVWDLSLLVDFWPFLAGLVLTQVRRPLSWIAVGVLFTLYISVLYYPPPVPNLAGQAAFVVSFTILSWTTYSLARLSTLVEVLRQAREDLARQAVVDERTRVARDLHDTLSFSLTAVALKAELCQRMLQSAPDEAGAQMAALPELAEQALVQLASLAESPVELRCEQELAAAIAVLESAGVQPYTVLDGWPLPREVDAVVAVVLREAITNVVKHSSARTCSITIASAAGAVRLRVANDGVAEHADIAGHARRSREPGQRGSGLVGMAERTGGRLIARPLPGGRFEVVAEFVTGPVADSAVETTGSAMPGLRSANVRSTLLRWRS